MKRPVVVALIFVLFIAALFSACSFLTYRARPDLLKAVDSGSLAARILIVAANFWARYAIFLTIWLAVTAVGAARAFEKWKTWKRDRAAIESLVERSRFGESSTALNSAQVAGVEIGRPLKTYRLDLTTRTTILFYGLPIFFVILIITIFVIRPGGVNQSPLATILWCFVVLHLAWFTARLPTSITISPEGTIIFASPIGKRVVAAQSVVSVRPGGMNRQGMLVLRHTRGKIYLSGEFEGFDDFVRQLRRFNPSVELQGVG